MKNIEINIGNACNNECKFCMVDFEAARGFAQFSKIKNEILKARKNGYESVGFLGGEFTLHPDVLKIIKLAKILGFKIIHVISNGRKYADQDFLDKLIKAGVNRFSVSIHSHDKEIEDGLTMRPGGYEEKIRGLKNLFKYEFENPVSVNLVINSKNYQQIIETLGFFHDMGVRNFRLNFIWLHGRAKENKDLYLKYSDFLPYIDKIIAFAQKGNINISFEGIPACLISNPEKENYLGELKDMRTNIVAFNNPDQKREEFDWQKRKQNDFKQKHSNCKLCEYDKYCEGVWNDYVEIYGWEEFNF